MGKAARKLAGPDVNKIVNELNKALADEWLAYLQYTNAAKIINGKMFPFVAGELESIAKEELEHADELIGRIIQLGGKPIVDPKEYLKKTNCGYEIPSESVTKAVKAGLKGEACAISVYDKIATMTREKDVVTFNLMIHIMEEEIDHEQRFEDIVDALGKK